MDTRVPPSTVLIADDEPDIARMIQVILEKRGFATRMAYSGAEALEILTREPIDLLLLDVMMPGLDGHGVLHEIRSSNTLRTIPVILLTAKDTLRDKIRGLELGADDYITKPFNNDELIARVQALLRIRGMSLEIERRNRELFALNSIATAINQSLNLSEMLSGVLEKVLEVLGLQRGLLRLLDESFGVLRLVAHRGVSAEYVRELAEVPLGERVSGRVALTGKTVLVEHAAPDNPEFAHIRRIGEAVDTLLCVPLLAKGRVLGTLSITSAQHRSFTVEEVQLVESIGYQMGVGIENSRLYEDTRSDAHFQQTLAQIALVANSTLELAPLLTLVCRETAHLFQVSETHLWLVDEGGKELVGTAAHGPNSSLLIGLRVSLSDTTVLAARVVQERRAIYVNAVPKSELQEGFLAATFHPRAVLAAPFISRGKVLGALVLIDMEHDTPFTPLLAQRAEIIAGQLAIAISNARLFEEREHRSQELSALHAIATATTHSLELTEILNLALDKIAEGVTSEMVRVRLLHPETQELVLRASRGSGALPVTEADQRRRRGEGFSGRVAATGRPLTAETPRDQESLLGEWPRGEVYYHACVPLLSREQVVGTLSVARRVSPYTEADLQLLTSIGVQIGIALENARLFDETREALARSNLLYELSNQLHSARSLEDTLEMASQQIMEAFRAQSVVICRMNESQEIFSRVGVFLSERHRGDFTPLSDGPARTILRTGQPLVVPDVTRSPEALHPLVVEEGAQAALAVPLQGTTRAHGVLFIYYRTPRSFHPVEVETLVIYANHLGSALENSQLFEETEWRARELSALYTVASAASSSLDVDQILGKALDAVLEVTGMEAGHIRLLEGDPPRLILKVHRGISLDLMERRGVEPRVGGRAEQVLATRRSLIIDSIPVEETGDVRGEALSEGFTAAAWVPIILQEQVTGIIAVRTRGMRTFPRDQIPLLDSIGVSLGVALERVRLFAREQKRTQELTGLIKAGQAVNSSLEMEAVLQSIVILARQVMGVDAVNLMLLDERGEELIWRALVGFPPDWAAVGRSKVRGSLAGWVVAEGTPLQVLDIASDWRMARPDLARKHGFLSYLGIPVRARDTILGVLSFFTTTPRRFSEEEVALAATFADQAAVAITNARVYQSVRRYAASLMELYEASAQVSAALDLPETLDLIARNAGGASRAASSSIVLCDEGGKVSHVTLWGFDPGVEKEVLQEPVPFTERVRETRRPLVLPDFSREEPGSISPYLLRVGRQAAVCTPLIYKDRVPGVMWIHYNEPRAFTDEDLYLLFSFANQAAVAIENARLFEEKGRQSRELATLNAVAETVSGSLELQEILDKAVDKVVEILQVDAGWVRLLEEETRELVLTASRGLSLEYMRSTARISTEGPLVSQVLRSGLPLIVEDVTLHPEEEVRQRALQSGFRSFLFTPLKAKNRFWGLLTAASRTPRPFPSTDVTLLTSIGHQIGVAIENARLFGETHRLAITDELTGLFNHRHFYDQLDTEFLRARRYGRPLAVMMVDIDFFKEFNDRYGHLAGDQVLHQIAGVLRHNVRAVDIVARYGGEEFAVILPETEARQAWFQGERLRVAVEQHPFVVEEAEKPITLTVSLGMAALTSAMRRMEELVRDADTALYRAKSEGRNRVCLA